MYVAENEGEIRLVYMSLIKCPLIINFVRLSASATSWKASSLIIFLFYNQKIDSPELLARVA